MTPERFVPAKEAAEFLAITKRHLLAMARTGSVPAHPLSFGRRKQWRFMLSELATWLTTRCSVNYNDTARPVDIQPATIKALGSNRRSQKGKL